MCLSDIIILYTITWCPPDVTNVTDVTDVIDVTDVTDHILLGFYLYVIKLYSRQDIQHLTTNSAVQETVYSKVQSVTKTNCSDLNLNLN